MAIDDFDLAMIALAQQRGNVLVRQPDGSERLAMLIHWRGTRSRRCGHDVARIQYLGGGQRTVDTADVRPIPKEKK